MGLIPRFYDIMKFLPNYSIDENEIVEIAAGYLGGDLDQRFYAYGPLMSYLLAGVYLVMALFSPLTADQLVQQVFFDNTQLYYAARFLNGCLAIGTGWVVFIIIIRLWGRALAWFSLPLLMFPFLDIVVAFTVRVDTLLGLLYALTILFMVKAINEKIPRNLLLSAFFSGLAFVCKPLPALLLFPSLMAGFLFMEVRKRKDISSPQVEGTLSFRSLGKLFSTYFFSLLAILKERRIYFFVLVFIATVLLFFPHAFLNWGGKDGFVAQQTGRIAFEGAKNSTPGWQIHRHLGVMGLVYVCTGIIGMVVGLIRAFWRNQYERIVVLMLPMVMLLAFSPFSARGYWYAPVVSFFACGVVVVAEALFNRLKSGRIKLFAGFVLLLLMLVEPVTGLARQTKVMIPNDVAAYEKVHTAFAAAKWITRNIPDSTAIGLYGYYVQMPRLVDRDINRFGNVAEFYMYYKSKNKYFIRQFELAYGRYLSDSSNRTYRLIDEITFTDDTCKKVKLDLRYRTRTYDAMLLDLLRANSTEYLVTTYAMDEEWSGRLVRSFLRAEFSYGSEIFIYRIGH